VRELEHHAVATQLSGLQAEIRQEHEHRADQADDLVPGELDLHLTLPSRWRTASNMATPAATETLRLSIVPGIRIRTSPSQCSRVSRRMPSPSPPSTSATLPLRSMPYSDAGASPSRP